MRLCPDRICRHLRFPEIIPDKFAEVFFIGGFSVGPPLWSRRTVSNFFLNEYCNPPPHLLPRVSRDHVLFPASFKSLGKIPTSVRPFLFKGPSRLVPPSRTDNLDRVVPSFDSRFKFDSSVQFFPGPFRPSNDVLRDGLCFSTFSHLSVKDHQKLKWRVEVLTGRF